MVRDTVSHLRGRGAEGLPRRRALLRRLPRQPRLRARGAAHGVRRRRRGDRAVRHQRRDAARLGRRRRARRASRRPGSGSASTATTTPAARSPTPWPPSTPARRTCRAPSTGTASAPATPTWSRSWPTSSSSWTGRCCPPGLLEDATRIAHAVAEVTNFPPASRQPYVGTSAFTHKAGLHASAIKVDPNLYQHIDPLRVGNDMRLLVSDMAGRASIELKGRELGFDLSGDKELVTRVTERVKALESSGFTFEAADASFELLLVEEVEGARPSYFDVESWRVITETRPRRRGGVRGDREAARRRRPLRRHRRGQRPGQRARPGAARGDRAGVPGGREVRADRLQGADPRPGPRHRRDHAGADRDLATASRRG